MFDEVVLGFAKNAIFVIVGCCLASFDFHIEGLAGLVLGDKAKRRYSLMSLARPSPGSSKDARGALSLEMVYFFFGFALPLVQLVLLTVLWVVPLSLKFQQRTVRGVRGEHVVGGFRCVCRWRRGRFIRDLQVRAIHGRPPLRRSNDSGKHLDRRLGASDRGGDVSTELTRGAWVLLPAAFVSGVVGVVLLRKAKAKLDNRVGLRGRRTTWPRLLLPRAM